MIPIPAGVRVWLATGHTDMRRGMQGLALTVQEGLKRDPHAGDLYISEAAAVRSSNAFGMMAKACACSRSGLSGVGSYGLQWPMER